MGILRACDLARQAPGGAAVLIAEPAVVLRVEEDSAHIQRVVVQTESEPECPAICYPDITGRVAGGQRVIVNTTAVRLGLGSGGSHFVMWADGRKELEGTPGGHIMKLRYTPMQIACGAAEESAACLEAIEAFSGLDGMPVVVCELHSMLAPAAAGAAWVASAASASASAASAAVVPSAVPAVSATERVGCGVGDGAGATEGALRLAYIMTDGGALPAALSRTVSRLVRVGLVSSVITAGHAFGGDHEAVNVHSALIIAKQVVKCDVAIVCMGPGVVGTGTRFGTTAIEQGPALDAATRLRGQAIMAPRLSRGDPRGRHTPVSHHTITVLRDVCCLPCTVVLADDMDPAFLERAVEALEPALSGIGHRLALHPGEGGLREAQAAGLELSTMGRDSAQEPEFFLTASAAGAYAASLAVGCRVGRGEAAQASD